MMKRKVLFGIFTAMTFFVILGALFDPFANVAKAMQGSGTDTDPFIVKTAADLNSIRDVPDAFYQLDADIDLEDSIYTNWEPIQGFAGVFNGAGHTISGLVVDQQSENEIGLFGVVTLTGIVRDLRLERVNVTGYDYVGGLAGINKGLIQNSSVSGEISGSGVDIGGLVGVNSGIIDRGVVSGTVTSISMSYRIGGLVGINEGVGQITSSSVVGTVNSLSDYSGGLVGNNFGTIAVSFSAANVVSTGSFVGGNYKNIMNSYSTGFVQGRIDYTGGLIGTNENAGWSIGSFYDMDTSGQSDTGKGEPKSTADMQMKSTFINAGWDFNSTWGIIAGSYPTLGPSPIVHITYDGNGATVGIVPFDPMGYQSGDSVIVQGDLGGFMERTGYVFVGWNTEQDGSGTRYTEGDTFIMPSKDVKLFAQWKEWNLTGSGTELDPYIITTAGQLDMMRGKLSAHYRLGDHIELSGFDDWEPIGKSMLKPFIGSLDGNFFANSGLTINKPNTDDNVGLFGHVGLGGLIHNVELKQINVIGGVIFGGLVGSNFGNVSYSRVISGTITALGERLGGVGGLVGYNFGIVTNSSSDVSVTSGGNYISAGGLVGENHGSISNSFAMGPVGTDLSVVVGLVGGLAGASMAS